MDFGCRNASRSMSRKASGRPDTSQGARSTVGRAGPGNPIWSESDEASVWRPSQVSRTFVAPSRVPGPVVLRRIVMNIVDDFD